LLSQLPLLLAPVRDVQAADSVLPLPRLLAPRQGLQAPAQPGELCFPLHHDIWSVSPSPIDSCDALITSPVSVFWVVPASFSSSSPWPFLLRDDLPKPHPHPPPFSVHKIAAHRRPKIFLLLIFLCSNNPIFRVRVEPVCSGNFQQLLGGRIENGYWTYLLALPRPPLLVTFTDPLSLAPCGCYFLPYCPNPL
jgi:hypothetical protein